MKTTKGIPIAKLPEACRKMNPDLFVKREIPVTVSHAKLAIAPQTEESKLNKLEAAWLSILRRSSIPWIGIQCLTFKIGDDCRYTPDFIALHGDGKLTAYETKGFWRDDALVKIKAAARTFRWLRFVTVQKLNGEWIEEEIQP